MKWLAKIRNEILRKWKNNEISLAEAASELVRTGMPASEAWALCERT